MANAIKAISVKNEISCSTFSFPPLNNITLQLTRYSLLKLGLPSNSFEKNCLHGKLSQNMYYKDGKYAV